MLRQVVCGVANEWLRVDHEPRLSRGLKDITRVQVCREYGFRCRQKIDGSHCGVALPYYLVELALRSSRFSIEQLNRLVADSGKLAPAPLFSAGENVPDYRPG